jgi:hypothetical protein
VLHVREEDNRLLSDRVRKLIKNQK